MASALGGLVDAYVDSDEGEGEEAAQGKPFGKLARLERFCLLEQPGCCSPFLHHQF